VEIVYTASVNSDIAEQARVVEDTISKGVDAIGISCNEPTGCEAPINKAVEAGVPVMTWDSDSPNSQRFTYLGVDNVEGGKAAAELLKEALPDGGKVALLTGVPGAANLEARITGFKEGIQGSKLEIVTTVACNDDINTGVQVVEETMQKYPDLKGWFFVVCRSLPRKAPCPCGKPPPRLAPSRRSRSTPSPSSWITSRRA
jgi:ribose transport system substrate-binding protein